MQISWRVAFLIVAAAGAMHLSLWKVFVVLVGYMGFEQLDRMLSQRAKEKAIHDVMCGWKVSAEDPAYEDKGKVSRARLKIVTGKRLFATTVTCARGSRHVRNPKSNRRNLFNPHRASKEIPSHRIPRSDTNSLETRVAKRTPTPEPLAT